MKTMDPSGSCPTPSLTYADGHELTPLLWPQNSIVNETEVIIPLNSTPLSQLHVQYFEEDARQKEKAFGAPPTLRMLIDEVELLVQQVEKNIGAENIHEMIDNSNTARGHVPPEDRNTRSQSTIQKEKRKKRARKFEVDKERWKRNSNKRKRMMGVAYETVTKSADKCEYSTKEARTMKPPCNCSLSKKSSRMKCRELTEKDRSALFDRFWKKMNWGEKKIFVSTLVEAVPIKQHRSLLGKSRRDKSMIFYLLKGRTRVRVCKTMFLNTLDVGEWSVRHWVENSKRPGRNAGETNSKRSVVPSQNRQHMINFLKLLPTVRSPYSGKQYCLEPNWQSINEVYREYVNYCTTNAFEKLSHTSFRHEFSKLNYSLYKPKNESSNSHQPSRFPEEQPNNFQSFKKSWPPVQQQQPTMNTPTEHYVTTEKKTPAKRAKKFEVDEMSWKRNSNKRKRMSGVAYESLKKTNGKYVYVKKGARKMRPPCNCSLSKRSSKMLCNELTERDRISIFDNFWKNMTWGQKKVYVSTLVEAVPVKQHRSQSESEPPRRDKSLIFHLIKDGKRIRVCKVMFLNTLAVGEWSVHSWVMNSAEPEPINVPAKSPPTPSMNRQQIVKFLKLLPTLESHYPGTDTKKYYLEPNWQSVNEVYRAYVRHCVENGFSHLSHTSFRFQFAKLNYSLCKPSK